MIDKMQLALQSIELRKKLGEDEFSPINIFTLVQNIDNLTLVFYPLGKNISGICYKGKKSSVITINSTMSRGRQCFSLAHELYHLYYDRELVSSISRVSFDAKDETEKKADQFASYFLIPSYSLYDRIKKIKGKKKKLTIEDVISLEQYFGVSHLAMLYRLKEEGELSSFEINEYKQNVINIANRLGYDVSLYYPSDEKNQSKVYGYHIKQIERLYNEEKISTGKYEEVLLESFREDIVYGFSEIEEGEELD